MIAQHQGRWPVSVLCEVLPGGRSGLYASVQQQTSCCGEAEEAARIAWVHAIAATTRHSYGSRRRAKPLQDDGFAVGRDNAKRLMRQAKGTVERPERCGLVTTGSRPRDAVAPALLVCQLEVELPDPVCVGGIPSLEMTEGWVSLAV